MSNKYNLSGKNIFNEKTGKQLETTVFLRGVVASNYDETDSKRIKVRINGIDDHLRDDELPYAFPMLPKFLNITPKKGEMVFMFVPAMDSPYLDRTYLGPVISQPQMLFKDTYNNGSTSGLDSGFVQKKPAPSTLPENKGVYPADEDIAFQGRDNSDIIFKPKEVLIRAGQFEINTKQGDIPKFNKKTPSYIQIKNNVVVSKANDVNEIGGVINVVSSKINLLTHKNGSPQFILNDQDNMIPPEELERIIKEAHPLVFGDLLLTYLKLQRNAFISHVHPYNGMVPEDLSGRNDINDYLTFDLDSMVSKNIKIN